MEKTLICERNGEVLAFGKVRNVEEFIFIEIPDKYPEVMATVSEFYQWLKEHEHWRVLE